MLIKKVVNYAGRLTGLITNLFGEKPPGRIDLNSNYIHWGNKHVGFAFQDELRFQLHYLGPDIRWPLDFEQDGYEQKYENPQEGISVMYSEADKRYMAVFVPPECRQNGFAYLPAGENGIPQALFCVSHYEVINSLVPIRASNKPDDRVCGFIVGLGDAGYMIYFHGYQAKLVSRILTILKTSKFVKNKKESQLLTILKFSKGNLVKMCNVNDYGKVKLWEEG